MKWHVVVMMALLLGGLVMAASYADDPYEEVAHDQRQIAIGISGAGDDNSLSATLIVPIKQDRIEGWAGGFAQQQSSDGEISAQVINAHTTVGYSVHERVSLNAFADWNRDKQRGIAGQTQFGAFVGVDIYEQSGLLVNGGAGNFLENKQARDDLGVKDTDPNVVRALAYVRGQYQRYSAVWRFTPKVDLSDIQFTLEPTATYTLSDTLSLVVKAKLGYESEPLVEGEEVFTAYQLQLSAAF